MKPVLLAPLLALLGGMAPSFPAGAQTAYRCTAADGRVTFQQGPCDGSGGGVKVEARPNVIEGRPAGDQETRRAAERSFAVRMAIAERRAIEGMTEQELREALGAPIAVDTLLTDANSPRKRLVFRDGRNILRHVLLDDGIVVAVGERDVEAECRRDTKNPRLACR